jgi:N-methylhydantoinase A/acetophenone carboxylase
VHACGYGAYVETEAIMTFPFASVFSAYGIANTDFVQAYEAGDAVALYEPAAGGWLTDFDAFNDVVKGLQVRALRDAEDLGARNVQWSLELQMRYAIQPHLTRIRSPRLFLGSDADVQELYAAFEREYARVYSSSATYLPGGVEIIGFTLWSTVPTPKIEMPRLKLVGEDPSGARTSSRPTFWGTEVGWLDSSVFRRERLQPGNVVNGPAVVEAVDTTIVIDPARRLRIDDYGNGVIEKEA